MSDPIPCPDCHEAVIAIGERIRGRLLLNAEPEQRYIVSLAGRDAGTPYLVSTYSEHECMRPDCPKCDGSGSAISHLGTWPCAACDGSGVAGDEPDDLNDVDLGGSCAP